MFASLVHMQCQLLCWTGTKQHTRYIDICGIGQSFGDGVYQALPGLHALTGCDTTSAFVGKGKKAGLQLIMNNECLHAAMARLGQSFVLASLDVVACMEFTCAFYSKRGTAVPSPIDHG